jgi:hypothetical protein
MDAAVRFDIGRSRTNFSYRTLRNPAFSRGFCLAAAGRANASPPVATVPVMVAVTPSPVTVTPSPVAVVPSPVTVMPVVTPPHLFELEGINLLLRNHRRFHTPTKRSRWRRNRRQRRRLRVRSQCNRARNKSNAEFQEQPAFHHIHPFHPERDEGSFAVSK